MARAKGITRTEAKKIAREAAQSAAQAVKTTGRIVVRGARAAAPYVKRGGIAIKEYAFTNKAGLLALAGTAIAAWVATMDDVRKKEWYSKWGWWAVPLGLVIFGLMIRSWARRNGRYEYAEMGLALAVLGMTIFVYGLRAYQAAQPKAAPKLPGSTQQTNDPEELVYIKDDTGDFVPMTSLSGGRTRIADAASSMAEQMFAARAA
jgi:hypothetical protein